MKKTIMAEEALLEELRDIKILQYLSEEEKKSFVKICEIYETTKNEKIIQEGEVSSNFFAVLKGIVTVMVTDKSGKDIYICSIAENEIFGESALFVNVKRTANVVSLDQAMILSVDRKLFVSFIRENPNGGLKILMLIIYSLLQKLRDAKIKGITQSRWNDQLRRYLSW